MIARQLVKKSPLIECAEWQLSVDRIRPMTKVEIRELRAHADELIRRVTEEGETIELVDGDKAVARIVPVEEPFVFSRGMSFEER